MRISIHLDLPPWLTQCSITVTQGKRMSCCIYPSYTRLLIVRQRLTRHVLDAEASIYLHEKTRPITGHYQLNWLCVTYANSWEWIRSLTMPPAGSTYLQGLQRARVLWYRPAAAPRDIRPPYHAKSGWPHPHMYFVRPPSSYSPLRPAAPSSKRLGEAQS